MTTSYQRDDSLDSAAEFTDNVESRETLGKVFEIVYLFWLCYFLIFFEMD
jgi:phosphate transport system permease protein